MKFKFVRSALLAAISGLTTVGTVGLGSQTANADNFSFTGSFTNDSNVQLFNFTVGAPSTVTLLTYSYAGGTNSAGTVIPEGGFDPILALFNSSGTLIGQNDDGGSNVPASSVTGAHFDTFLQSALGPGNYTVSVMEYNNFAIGPNLSNGFEQSNPTFTAIFGCSNGIFCDVTEHNRTSNWAFDILNVQSGSEVSNVPLPASLPPCRCSPAASPDWVCSAGAGRDPPQADWPRHIGGTSLLSSIVM
jgi:hypothetical protein